MNEINWNLIIPAIPAAALIAIAAMCWVVDAMCAKRERKQHAANVRAIRNRVDVARLYNERGV
jgi:hypothetical protein